MYYGYCQRSQQYRMMDFPEYVSNMHEGVSRMVNDSASAYQDMFRGYPNVAGGTATMPGSATRHHHHRDCDCGCREHRGCRDCHCECCVCDADILVHVRCGELRRIPLTFDNDTRRDRPVTLELGKFLTSGGRDLGWTAKLSETSFTLHPCDEHTVLLGVGIQCDANKTPGTTNQPPATGDVTNRIDVPGGTVDRCEVGYATIRAEGCLTRPIVVAIAVLPDDCDAYHHPCGCDCCH
jgi:hypothetical protein